MEETNNNVVFTNTASVPFIARVMDSDGIDVTESVKRRISWSVSDKTVIGVTYEGRVSGYKEGVATLTASFEGSSDSIKVTSKVMAKEEFVQTRKYVQMYQSETASLPYTCTTKNASVEVEIEDTSVLSYAEGKLSSSKTIGTTNVTFYSYEPSGEEGAASYEYKRVPHVFEAKVIPSNSPYFILDKEKATSGTASVAKNKYSELEYKALGISAYDCSEFNITGNIYVKDGEYDLTTTGTYQLVLEVRDNYGLTSIFDLTLEVTEYENRSTDAKHVGADCLNAKVTLGTNASTYSAAFEKVTVEAYFELVGYDEADITISLEVDVVAYEYQHGEKVDVSKHFRCSMIMGFVGRASLSDSFYVSENRDSYALATASITYSIAVYGYLYTHVSY